MQAPDFNSPPSAKTTVMWSLARHGGSMRIGSLFKLSGLCVDELCAALNELAERRWLTVTWRRTPRISAPERLRKVDRVTTTRFGRWRTPPMR
jgi:hypothetical protein